MNEGTDRDGTQFLSWQTNRFFRPVSRRTVSMADFGTEKESAAVE